VLGDLAVEPVRLLHLLLRLDYQIHVLHALLGDILILPLDRISQSGEYLAPNLDGADEVADFPHHGPNGVIIPRITKCDDLLNSLASMLVLPRCRGNRKGAGNVGTG